MAYTFFYTHYVEYCNISIGRYELGEQLLNANSIGENDLIKTRGNCYGTKSVHGRSDCCNHPFLYDVIQCDGFIYKNSYIKQLQPVVAV